MKILLVIIGGFLLLLVAMALLGKHNMEDLHRLSADKALAEQKAKDDTQKTLEGPSGTGVRKQCAEKLERSFLDKGIDAHVQAVGKLGNTLSIKWILMSRPFGYKIMNDGDFPESMHACGFKKVHFTNGSEWWDYGL